MLALSQQLVYVLDEFISRYLVCSAIIISTSAIWGLLMSFMKIFTSPTIAANSVTLLLLKNQIIKKMNKIIKENKNKQKNIIDLQRGVDHERRFQKASPYPRQWKFPCWDHVTMRVASDTLVREKGVRKQWLEEEKGLASIHDIWEREVPCKGPVLPSFLLNSHFLSSTPPPPSNSATALCSRLSRTDWLFFL